MYRQDLEAYVSLEEARLRCERLDGQAGDSGERGMLRSVHRELGLAGFFASERTPRPQRLDALTMARRQAGVGRATAEEVMHPVRALVEDARAVLERGLGAPELTDHLDRAREHLLKAQRLLASELQGNPRQTRAYTSSKPTGRQSRLQPGRSPSST